MVTSPKFPHDCDKEYILNPEKRKMFFKHDYLLTIPVSSFGDISRHIDSLPENELMN
jgi:hypothetical protein